MSGPGDGWEEDEMDELEQLVRAAGGTELVDPPDAGLLALVGDLRSLTDSPPPVPSDELAALLRGDLVHPRRVRRLTSGRRSRVITSVVQPAAVAAAVAAAVIAVVVLAAAKHALPAPAQRLVSDVVNYVSPVDIDQDGPSPASSTAPDRPSKDSRTPGQSGGKVGATATEPAPRGATPTERSGPAAGDGGTSEGSGDDSVEPARNSDASEQPGSGQQSGSDDNEQGSQAPGSDENEQGSQAPGSDDNDLGASGQNQGGDAGDQGGQGSQDDNDSGRGSGSRDQGEAASRPTPSPHAPTGANAAKAGNAQSTRSGPSDPRGSSDDQGGSSDGDSQN